MKRIVGRSFKLAALLVLGAVCSPACTDEDGIIFVQNNLAPPQSRQNNECVYQPDPTASFLPEGTFDVGVSSAYVVNLLVGNQMIQRGDNAAPRAETNRVHIDGAVVRVTGANGEAINSFTSLTSALAQPSTANLPGYTIVRFEAIDQATVGKINYPQVYKPADSRLVVANIKVFGKTIGGVDVESAEWSYPIRVCYGCTLSFATGDDPTQTGIDCKLASSTTSTSTSTVFACNRGQDESTPCQQCLDKPLCNGVGVQ